MKEKESALFSRYIIDGIQQDATPYEMLAECMSAPEPFFDSEEEFNDILDESTDPPLTSFTYSNSFRKFYCRIVYYVNFVIFMSIKVFIQVSNFNNPDKYTKETIPTVKVNVKDIAGNEATAQTVLDQTKTSNGRTVVYDCKNPVIEGVNNKYFYTNPITIKAVDSKIHNVSPIASATIDGEAYELGTEYAKEGTHEFVAYDRAGNRVRVTFTIDLTAPKLTVKEESVGTDFPYNGTVMYQE